MGQLREAKVKVKLNDDFCGDSHVDEPGRGTL